MKITLNSLLKIWQYCYFIDPEILVKYITAHEFCDSCVLLFVCGLVFFFLFFFYYFFFFFVCVCVCVCG